MDSPFPPACASCNRDKTQKKTMAIELPDGMRVPAVTGKCRIVLPPDLNLMEDMRFLLEYDFPFLVVKDGDEYRQVIYQAWMWEQQHPNAGGLVVPSMSYIDKETSTRLTRDEKHTAYMPCVPAVVIELVKATDTLEDLQARVSTFLDAGTRQGVVVDAGHERIWIYNRDEEPCYYDELVPTELDSWPGFTLDCQAIRDARKHAGLD
ncbi:hypothetical protein AC1031_004029 [Aphanomyces cochlioides]|nr:hypothetical protein AC1031_004029 [Aphanomyces cochlioides]